MILNLMKVPIHHNYQANLHNVQNIQFHFSWFFFSLTLTFLELEKSVLGQNGVKFRKVQNTRIAYTVHVTLICN